MDTSNENEKVEDKSQSSSIFHYDHFQERTSSYNINIIPDKDQVFEKENENEKRRT
jgi:hypothetical protein